MEKTETDKNITTRITEKIVSYVKERGLNERIVRLLVAEAVVKGEARGRAEMRRRKKKNEK
tara:strand:+ start:1874 stop:2056 length:183 start_codon:yes stop_codon:yes gene_type:complete